MKLMKRAGCWQIAYGIESGSQRVLERRQARGEAPAHARDAAHDARGRHPRQGLPDDRPPDRDASRASRRRASFLRDGRRSTSPGDEVHAVSGHARLSDHPRARHLHRGLGAHERDELHLHPERPHRTSSRDLLPPTLPSFYRRPDVLRGIVRMVVEEPRFLRQLSSSAWVYLKSQLPDRRFRRAVLGRSPIQPSLAS